MNLHAYNAALRLLAIGPYTVPSDTGERTQSFAGHSIEAIIVGAHAANHQGILVKPTALQLLVRPTEDGRAAMERWLIAAGYGPRGRSQFEGGKIERFGFRMLNVDVIDSPRLFRRSVNGLTADRVPGLRLPIANSELIAVVEQAIPVHYQTFGLLDQLQEHGRPAERVPLMRRDFGLLS